MGAMLFNLSFVIGGSPDAGWTNYAPLATDFSAGYGINFYLLGVQIAGIGTLMTGINFSSRFYECVQRYDINENADVYLVFINYKFDYYFRFPSFNSGACFNVI